MKDNELLMFAKSLPVSVLIQDFTRPGSDFLQSLLDGHPQILQTTGSRMQSFWKFWSDLEGRVMTVETLINRFIYNPEHYAMFDSRFNVNEQWDRLGREKNQFFQVSAEKFTECMLKVLEKHELTMENFFFAVHIAYWMAQGKSISRVRALFFHVHGFERLSAYPFLQNPHVFISTRELRDGWVSYVENRPVGTFEHYHPLVFLRTIEETRIFRHLDQFDAVTAVPLSRLHSDPSGTMRQIADRLKVDYLPSILLNSSYQSMIWWGDSWSKDLHGFNPLFGADKKWKPFFTRLDSILLESLFFRLYIAHGYELVSNSRQRKLATVLAPILIFKPMKFELRLIRVNLANRKRSLPRNLLLFSIMYWRRVRTYYLALIHFSKLSKKNQEPFVV